MLDRMDSLADLRTSDALRARSKEAFNSSFRLEVALTIMRMPTTFIFDDLYTRVAELATSSGVDPPSQSAVRIELRRLREVYGALARMPRVKGESVKREVRQESGLWALCTEVYERVHGDPDR
jgi:hypothetical protein